MLLISILIGLASMTLAFPAFPQGSGDGIKLEWFTWSFFRITSPNGKLILTNPWLTNPDSNTKLEDIDRADVILVATAGKSPQDLDKAMKALGLKTELLNPQPGQAFMLSK